MSLRQLAWRLLRARPMALALSVLLLALGWAAVGFVLLVSEQLEQRMQRDLAGIDLVVGAKGSPMQIMLSGVFHIDVPTGNIPLATVEQLRSQPLVKEVWPISLGDSLRGWRIVGSTPEYLDLFGARLQAGRRWSGPMQAVLGHEVARATGLKPGDRFVGSHGLGLGGEEHAQTPFEVVGVLARGSSVLDRLVLTDLVSVWRVHEDLHEVDEEDRAVLEAERQVTMALVRYRSPLGAAMLPRWVNAQESLQAAAPAVESARLLRMVGAGREVLQGFGGLLLVTSLLSLFITQMALVRERQGDLALLRLMGAPPWRLAWLMALQSLIVVGLSLLLGLLLAHAAQAVLALWLAGQQSLPLLPDYWSPTELRLWPLALVLALLAAALPAWRAMRTEVTQLLQTPR
ncbi:MAG: ABC transporter permease [Burkholderiales bacterium]|uniref:ABC transporter permease n=1 Tax=Inhella sp. TaxID=1921806 RepID=UPI001AD089CA|nr:ABC transporter permease [Burkholderiales bacterium]